MLVLLIIIMILILIIYFFVKNILKLLIINSYLLIISGYLLIIISYIIRIILKNKYNYISITKISNIILYNFINNGLMLILTGAFGIIIYTTTRILKKKN